MMDENETRNTQVQEAMRLLEAAGFTLSVSACGCCQGPWVRLTHNGREIISDDKAFDLERRKVNIHMHEAVDISRILAKPRDVE